MGSRGERGGEEQSKNGRRKSWGGKARLKSNNKQRSLGPEWSISEFGTPPTHNSGKPHGLVASNNNNNNIVTNFASVLFNTQVKALRHDGHISIFRNFMFYSILHNNKSIKGVTGDNKIITVAFGSICRCFCIILDILKEWVRKVDKKHEIMNKISS